MRAGMLALLLAAGLVPDTWAQTTPETARETARRAEMPRTAIASDLQGYALLLQDAEGRLRQAKEAATRGPEQSQQGALSRDREELAHAGQAALQSVQNVPPSLADTEVYKQAERRFRHNLVEFGSTQRMNGEKGIAAAEEALQTLAELRQQVARAAGEAGGSIPAPPAATSGGANR
jgi:hypothetical protein